MGIASNLCCGVAKTHRYPTRQRSRRSVKVSAPAVSTIEAAPLSKESGAKLEKGEIVRCKGKKNDPKAQFVVIEKITETIGGTEYKIVPWAPSRQDLSDYEGLLGMRRKSHEIESLGTFVPNQLTLQPTPTNLFAERQEKFVSKQQKQSWKLGLKATAESNRENKDCGPQQSEIKESIGTIDNLPPLATKNSEPNKPDPDRMIFTSNFRLEPTDQASDIKYARECLGAQG